MTRTPATTPPAMAPVFGPEEVDEDDEVGLSLGAGIPPLEEESEDEGSLGSVIVTILLRVEEVTGRACAIVKFCRP